MKFEVLFKTPDALLVALADLGVDEIDDAKELGSRFIKYGEYLTVEFDTESESCRVIPIK